MNLCIRRSAVERLAICLVIAWASAGCIWSSDTQKPSPTTNSHSDRLPDAAGKADDAGIRPTNPRADSMGGEQKPQPRPVDRESTADRPEQEFESPEIAPDCFRHLPPPTAEPPYRGTIFISSEIIRDSDPSDFQSITAAGTGQREMFDRRTDSFRSLRPYLFKARYTDNQQIEIQVNPEFAASEAAEVAEKYARAYGQLPRVLRAKVRTSAIHQGVHPFGGAPGKLLVHVGQGVEYERDGILLETLFHEATHSSIDSYHANAKAWCQAQAADRRFISDYAQEHPGREDLAETMLLWFAVRHRRERMPADLIRTVEVAIPARLRYFDGLRLDVRP